MGKTTEEIVQEQAKACVCGKTPVWVKARGGAAILACPTINCELYLAVRGPTFKNALEAWNREVDQYGKRRN